MPSQNKGIEKMRVIDDLISSLLHSFRGIKGEFTEKESLN